MENQVKLTPAQKELINDLNNFDKKRKEDLENMINKYPGLLTPLIIEGHHVYLVINQAQFNKL